MAANLRYLMFMLQRWKMKKLVCTVLKGNHASMDFFTKKLKFSIDVTSPSLLFTEHPYEILSTTVLMQTMLQSCGRLYWSPSIKICISRIKANE
eukprot:m.114989 g.114989  ORF g.114989 m.114989 type:complete len:94 (+) comp37530_c0_seq10:1061-1342(+)